MMFEDRCAKKDLDAVTRLVEGSTGGMSVRDVFLHFEDSIQSDVVHKILDYLSHNNNIYINDDHKIFWIYKT